MNSNQYIKEVLKTENASYKPAIDRVSNPEITRLLHAAVGAVTESAEFIDVIKKHTFYGKPLDVPHLKEELSDVLWYVAVACDSLGTSFEELMDLNIKKLRARYGEKFTEEAALNRNLTVERNILESHGKTERKE